MRKKIAEIQPENNTSALRRVKETVKRAMHKVGEVLDDLGNPNKHIDNPDGLKYYEKEGFAEKREAEIAAQIAAYKDKGDKGIDY
ncbi:MAG: hypothetical protein IJ770_04905 [Alphaproteobacteria bacterium]|nr:hypothetical protein [Alphaproteobacteria bacterium]